ncbi:hypothetical protein Tco_1434622 [Tanacetum coccineum]
MDFHELFLVGDLSSIDIQNRVVDRRFPVVDDVICRFLMCRDDDRSVLSIACGCVQGVEVSCSIPSSLKNALSVLFKNLVPLSVRTEIIGA